MSKGHVLQFLFRSDVLFLASDLIQQTWSLLIDLSSAFEVEIKATTGGRRGGKAHFRPSLAASKINIIIIYGHSKKSTFCMLMYPGVSYTLHSVCVTS